MTATVDTVSVTRSEWWQLAQSAVLHKPMTLLQAGPAHRGRACHCDSSHTHVWGRNCTFAQRNHNTDCSAWWFHTPQRGMDAAAPPLPFSHKHTSHTCLGCLLLHPLSQAHTTFTILYLNTPPPPSTHHCYTLLKYLRSNTCETLHHDNTYTRDTHTHIHLVCTVTSAHCCTQRTIHLTKCHAG